MRNLLESVVRGAELLAARSGSLPLSDAEIVRRLTLEHDQSVFVLLVRRHAPLVWGVCRQMLPHDQDAEDAFQATFLALVRSLEKVRKQESLGPWLHGVAYRIAMKIRREAARRKQREVRVGREERSQPVADSTWNRLQGIVHEEIASLPESLREAFVLCCLEGRSQHEAAEQLGWKLGTLSARVTQARQRLLERLTRRDIALSTAAAMLGSNMTSGGPALALSSNAAALVSARIESIPTTINALSQGVVPMMWTRTKLAVLGIVFGGLVTTGIGWMATSEAQTPAIQAEIDHYLKALRNEKTEYRFVQIVKPLTIEEMKKVLATSEHEGWTYCGTQELIARDSKPQPHMVFKRAKAAVAQEPAQTPLEQEHLALQKALEAKVRAEVQARLRLVEQDRAEEAIATHLKQRVQNLNDSITTANKRILDVKAALDIANKAGKEADIQRHTNDIKAAEELKAKLEVTLKKEQADLALKQSIAKKEAANLTEDHVARLKAEIQNRDQDLKPQRAEELKERLDLELSRKKQAEFLEAESQRQKIMDSEKREQLFKERIHRLEEQSQKLSEKRLSWKKESNAIEDEITGLRQKMAVASLNENRVEADKLAKRIKDLEDSKIGLNASHEDLNRQLKELALAREAFLRELTQNEIESIRSSTERTTTPAQDTMTSNVLKTYSFPPSLPWKHAAEFMKVFETQKGNIAIKKEGDQYLLIITASPSAHSKAAEYIKKNNIPISTK